MAHALSLTFWRVLARIFGVVLVAGGALLLSRVPDDYAFYHLAVADAEAAAAVSDRVCGLALGASTYSIRYAVFDLGSPLLLVGAGLLVARQKWLGAALLIGSAFPLLGAVTCGVPPRLWLCFNGVRALLWPFSLVLLALLTVPKIQALLQRVVGRRSNSIREQ